MRNPAPFFLVLLFCVRCVFAEEEVQQKEQPGIFKRAVSRLNIFHRNKPRTDTGTVEKKRSTRLQLDIKVSPEPLRLSDAHQLEVTVVLTNNTKSMVQMEFKTSQRFEVLLRNDLGKVINQWSENQSFTNDEGYLTLNPHEQVEYSASISGRDMVAGKIYTVEAFVPDHREFSATKTIAPSR